ncbi:MAG: nucleotidyltransferase domain-containing protein [Planctomycetes bacterium]|nr:nucleotidyltransferase domain-containing protein [Planctomycetota bacterium]
MSDDGGVPVEQDPRVQAAADALPHPLAFASISGAHLYGFASPDSDFDVRATHVLPAEEFVGLRAPIETITVTRKDVTDGRAFELDLVSHDIAKFARMMLQKNGYVLEQLTSPLVVRTSPLHDELRALVPACLTRHHVYHYLGFAATEWKLFLKGTPRRVKPLLYVYRVLLTGIRLMRTGEIEANLSRLNDEFRLPWIADLVALKTSGAEKTTLDDADVAFHSAQRLRLEDELRAAAAASGLQESPTAEPALHDFVVRARLSWLRHTPRVAEQRHEVAGPMEATERNDRRRSKRTRPRR